MPGADGQDGVEYSLDEDQTPSMAVVHAVAAFTNTAALDLPPLYNTVDTEALDGLVENDHTSELTFTYAGCEVTVNDGITVTITVTTASD